MKNSLERELVRMKEVLEASLADKDVRIRTAMETASNETMKYLEELTAIRGELQQVYFHHLLCCSSAHSSS